ncbi:MAG: MFS transporter [Candidatus Methanosuratincola petrocarbonis]|nr:MFS transporter [Candidatus Methanosuratincola sp.]
MGKGVFGDIPRSIMLMIIILAINNFAFGYLMVYISAYLPEIGVPATTVGLMLGMEGLTMAVMAIPFGIISDRKGRKNLLIAGSLGPFPMFLAFALTTDAAVMIVAAALGGLFEGVYLATVNALIADQTPLKDRNVAFTLSFILGGAGSALGMAFPFFFPQLGSLIGVEKAALHSGLLCLFAIFSLATPLFLWSILRGVKEAIRGSPGAWRGKGLGMLLKFSGINSIIGLGAGFIIPLIPTWLYLKFAVPDSFSGPILAIANATIGFGAAFSPKLASKLGSVKSIVLTQGLSLAFMVTLAFIGDFFTAALLYVIRTGLMNMASPLLDAYLMGIVHPEQRGFASSLNSVIWRIPNSITTIIGGAILASGNFELPFLVAGSFYAVGISLFYLSFKDVKQIG